MRNPPPDSTAALVYAVERLADELRIVRDVLDEIREDLNSVVRNESCSEHRGQHSVLKGMALDPTSDDWGERLNIVRSPVADDPGEVPVKDEQSDNPASEEPPSAESGKLF